MSWEASTYVLGRKVGSATRKLVLMGYANHASKFGTDAFPGIDTVAEYAECDRRTAQRHVKALVEAGWMREGDQQIVAHRRADQRPIVYDIAMTEETREQWAIEHAAGFNSRREAAAAAGLRGAEKRAEKRANGNPAERGDVLSPRQTASTPAVRGDDLSPRQDLARGDISDHHGVTSEAERGDMRVTQTIQEPPKGTVPTTSPSSNASSSPADAGDGEALSFEAFWAIYPRKAGKADARRAWDRAVRTTHPGSIIAGARRFAADPNLPTGEDAQYVAYPATWLNRGCWEDDPLPPRKGSRRGYDDEGTWGAVVAETAAAPAAPSDDLDEVFGIIGRDGVA